MKTVAVSTFYGALTGVILGGATVLVVDDNKDETFKWFFVGGTFFGFAYGVYHVSTRPEPRGLLDVSSAGLSVGVPSARMRLDHPDAPSATITLVSVGF